MGLGDEAGNSLREQRAAAEEAERNYRAHTFSSVPSAIMRWCRVTLGVSRPETFTVVKQFVDGHDTARWFGVEVEFQVDGVVFCGKVMSYNGSPHARLEGVRARKPD